MPKLSSFAPDKKIVVGAIVSVYVLALISAFVPMISPGAVAALVTPKK